MQVDSSFIIQPYHRKQLSGYFSRMSQDNLNPLWDDNVGRVLREQGFSVKESPRSIYRVEKLFEALNKFAPAKSPKVNTRDTFVSEGLRLARACFYKPKDEPFLELQAFTPEYVLSITTNRTGSPGLTAWGQTKEESYVRAFDRACQIIKGDKRPEPCLAFKRTQFNDKTRLVWGFPYSMTAIEGIFFRPLIDRFKCNPGVMAFAIPDLVLGSRLRNSSYRNKYCYVTDVSSFDSSASSILIHHAFLAVRSWFDLDAIEPTTGVPYSQIMDIVEYYFIHTPIVMPDGNVYKGKRHGVPSGSYGTQWVDSFINVVMAGTAGSKFHLNLDKRDILVLGDDLCFWSNNGVKYEAIAEFLSQQFSATLKPEKGSRYRYDQMIKFLGRYWNMGLPDLPQDDILQRMAFPESFRRYSKGEAGRYEAERLLSSFITQYRSASEIYQKVYIRGKNRYEHTLNDYWRHYRMAEKEVVRRDKGIINPDFLSGLQRYKFKYLGVDLSSPPDLQYWL